MKITKQRLQELIREEVELTLTNEEVGDLFGEDVEEQLEKLEQVEEELTVTNLGDEFDAPTTPLEKRIERLNDELTDGAVLEYDGLLSMLSNAIASNMTSEDARELKNEVIKVLDYYGAYIRKDLTQLVQAFDVQDIEV